MSESKFFKCSKCGNFVATIYSSGVPMICCGEQMQEIIPNTSEGAGEKHLPVFNVDGNTVNVNVGEIDHPMVDEHYIEWIYIQTEKGSQYKYLKSGDAPVGVFLLSDDDKVLAAYAYCNLHGLWKAEV